MKTKRKAEPRVSAKSFLEAFKKLQQRKPDKYAMPRFRIRMHLARET